MDNNPRMKRAVKTIEAMIGLYCHDLHHTRRGSLCSECRGLLEYAARRLETCPFGKDKTTCAKCPVHCYAPDMREEIRRAMRYAGPKMMYRHPVLALFHALDGLREEPGKKKLPKDT